MTAKKYFIVTFLDAPGGDRIPGSLGEMPCIDGRRGVVKTIGGQSRTPVREYPAIHGPTRRSGFDPMTLCSGNARHFKPIKQLRFRHFRP